MTTSPHATTICHRHFDIDVNVQGDPMRQASETYLNTALAPPTTGHA